jgi:serine/threonine protein kinase
MYNNMKKIISLNLNHIFIERCVGWTEDNENLYYVFPKPENITILSEIYDQLSDIEKLKISMNICFALKYLSEQKIIHLNLKLSNIIVKFFFFIII